MTVAQLIRKLQKMPQECVVTMSNDDTFFNGEYTVTSVETYDCKTVEICTDYKKLVEEKEQKTSQKGIKAELERSQKGVKE